MSDFGASCRNPKSEIPYHIMDTQWPRYEVFKQDTPNKPHQAVGSVHAPDDNMALQMARDVFVRRPKCHNLWVVPADAILMVTAQELEKGLDSAEPDSAPQPFHVFRKDNQRRSMTYVDHVGTINATSAHAALKAAREEYGDDAFVWWIVPDSAVITSDDVPVESWFAPALEKTYRHQSAYGFVHPQRQVRRRSQSAESEA